MSVATMQKEMDDMKNRLAHLEKVLIIGDGDRLPLAEIVRSLTKTVGEYIAQKDKEEQEKREEWNKLKWLVIGVVVPLIVAFVGQVTYFYFRILPLVESAVN